MFIYYNTNAIELKNVSLLGKVKNKTSNGYFYKINYNTEFYSLDGLIIKLNVQSEKDIQNFLKLENNLIYKIKIGNLNPTYNFNNFINKYKKRKRFLLNYVG